MLDTYCTASGEKYYQDVSAYRPCKGITLNTVRNIKDHYTQCRHYETRKEGKRN
jgi:hypothetical protein